MHAKKTIGILTAGGDCPGLNAAIRGIGKTAILQYGMAVKGFVGGYQGLLNREFVELTERNLSGLLTLGGTILGTSREKPFKKAAPGEVDDKPDKIRGTFEALGLDCLVCIGGNGTQKTAAKLAKSGLPVVGIPKTIDNDVWGTDRTFGFDTAVDIAVDAIDRLHTTASSHRRIMVAEVMGHHAGWLALHSGAAGGGDAILIPEIPLDLHALADFLTGRAKAGKPYSIVVVAEGVSPSEVEPGLPGESSGRYLARNLERLTGIESRETILGYIQRGGSPSASDRILATRYGTAAADLIARGDFGRMVSLKGSEIVSVPLSEVAGKLKLVTPEDPLIESARKLHTFVGNSV
ncbi:MAG TPA: ATP-dependent 6-phosphofructokinase [Spirochaetia bacterium]|nr:ATP-dependent 6-phosphofructokinase [Spirochaetia bacterium]